MMQSNHPYMMKLLRYFHKKAGNMPFLRGGMWISALFVAASLFSWSDASALRPAHRKAHRPKGAPIVLVHADRLHFDAMTNPDANILNGHVHFRHGNINLTCDSAYYYKNTNSFEAFGNVHMTQGDTLSLTGEYIKYDGDAQIAQARKNVHLRHRATLLVTDSLNYDKLYGMGYFFDGGKLRDGGNTLVSDWGQYSPGSREAVFNYNVKLTNKKFTLTTDTLHYNTLSKVATIVGPSNILSDGNKIYTERGYYDTRRDYTRLFDRSVVQNGRSTMTGDTMYYDKKHGRMKAMGKIIYNDKANRNLLTGDYCEYSDTTGYAMATRNAVVRDYSSADTLYMHADTFKIFTYNIRTDSVYRIIHGYHKARAFRVDVQSVCDSLKYDSKDKKMTMYGNPIVWSNDQQLLGEEIQVFLNDSSIDSAHVIRQTLLVQRLDSASFNQVAGREMFAYFRDGELSWSKVKGNVEVAYYPYGSDSVMVGLNRMQTTELRMYMKDKKMNHIWSAPATGTMYPLKFATSADRYLENFAWFDYIRPKNKDDIFVWRDKTADKELRENERRQAPLQTLSEIARDKLHITEKGKN